MKKTTKTALIVVGALLIIAGLVATQPEGCKGSQVTLRCVER